MNSFSSSSFSPSTPKSLKILVVFTLICTLVASLLHPFVESSLGFPGPLSLMALSAEGLQSWKLWQVLSYLFIQASPNGIDLNYIILLIFNTYLMWVLGSTLIQEMGERRFFRFYFLLSLAVGLLTGLCLIAFQLPYSLLGNTSTLISLLILWSMLFPEVEVLLFLTFPVKVKILAFIWLGASLLINLSSGALAEVMAYAFASLGAYIYGVIALNLDNPFDSLRPMDRWVRGLFLLSSQPSPKANKIIAIHTQIYSEEEETEKDDEFMDRMLGKISKEGKGALSWEERCRLRRISKKSPNNFDF